MYSSFKPIRPGAIPFWMLNDASTVDQKITYLRTCQAAGFESMALHARSGNLIPYASREWFSMIAALVEEGQRLNMDIWLYDEDPFPSGAAGGLVMAHQPELKSRSMVWHTCPDDLCKSGGLWRISRGPVLWAGVIEKNNWSEVTNLTDQVGALRNEWAMTEWDSRHYYKGAPWFSCPRGKTVGQGFAMRVPKIPDGCCLGAVSLQENGSDGPWESLPDLLNPETFRLFRKLTLEPYEKWVGEHYGKTIPGIFTDEAKPHGRMPVTAELWGSFKARFGYDLRTRLYHLFGLSTNLQVMQTRLDYRRWIVDRFMETFMLPYRDYCDQVGLRLTGHFSPEDDPIAEAESGISVMSVMRAMSGPGTDIIVPMVGDQKAPMMNLGSLRAASVRARYGTGYCISESLALSDWTATTRLSRRILAWQKVLGIDRFFWHGFYMSSQGVQNFEAPPDYGPNSSIFAGMKVLNEWLKRLENRMEGGQETATVAVLNSVYSYWTIGDRPSKRQGRMCKSLWMTLLNSLSAQVGCHLLDDTELPEAKIEAGQFRVGNRSYTRLLVPAIEIMSESTGVVIEKMVQAGVPVVQFGGGADYLMPATGGLRRLAGRHGEIVSADWPGLAWCRRFLPRQARVGGGAAGHLFVRRFSDSQARTCLLAVNIAEQEKTFRLAPFEPRKYWRSVEVDGDCRFERGKLVWTVPGGGCGLFELVSENPVVGMGKRSTRIIPLTRRGISLTRLELNTARLSEVEVIRPDHQSSRVLPYPMPFWRCCDDYQARRGIDTFSGLIPIDSRPLIDSLTYEFRFMVDHGLGSAVWLVMDPNCARGRCEIRLNGKSLRRSQVFPLDGIHALRLPLGRAIRPGLNRLELGFALESALDGLLSQLFLEGDFHLSLAPGPSSCSDRRLPVLARSSSIREGVEVWRQAGLPHYMGRVCYRWKEQLTAADRGPELAWELALDQVVDSAKLRVNGQDAGARAWAPWRWRLPALRNGVNQFELEVSTTAGNRFTLYYPDQTQGWIGSGRLIGKEQCD